MSSVGGSTIPRYTDLATSSPEPVDRLGMEAGTVVFEDPSGGVKDPRNWWQTRQTRWRKRVNADVDTETDVEIGEWQR